MNISNMAILWDVNFSNNINLYWLLIAILAIGLFILGRELTLWYFKINRRVELLEEQNMILKKIFKQLGGADEELEKKESKGKYEIDLPGKPK